MVEVVSSDTNPSEDGGDGDVNYHMSVVSGSSSRGGCSVIVFCSIYMTWGYGHTCLYSLRRSLSFCNHVFWIFF